MRVIVTQQSNPQWPYAKPPELKHKSYDMPIDPIQITADHGWTIVQVIITNSPEEIVS